MGARLTDEDFCDGARLLDCHVSSIKAVALVESGGRGGFDEEGRILIRFEGHKFRKFTNKRYDASHPHLSYPYKVQHTKPHGRMAFNAAFALNAEAALLATSWGMFQPMGFNYLELEYNSVGEMVDDLKKGERQQLLAFCRLVDNWGLADELREGTLAAFGRFAYRYNGSRYKVNRYDTKMHNYKRQFASMVCPPPRAVESEERDPQSTPQSDISPVLLVPADVLPCAPPTLNKSDD